MIVIQQQQNFAVSVFFFPFFLSVHDFIRYMYLFILFISFFFQVLYITRNLFDDLYDDAGCYCLSDIDAF